MTECPICRGATRRLFVRRGYWVRECEACRHRFAEIVPGGDHVDRVYDDEYFRGGGAGYADYLSEARLLTAHGRRYAALVTRYAAAPGAVLDVGAAAGFVLAGFLEGGWSGRGVEPNARMAAYARDRLGLSVETGKLEELRTDERYDLVSMIQILPHFVDPARALRAASDVTRRGGHWLIETWNKDSWTARLMGRRWHEYSPPSVLHWFSPATLAPLAAQFGFREIARGRPRKMIEGAHAKSLLRYQFEGSRLNPLAARATDLIPSRFAIPYPAEDLFWSLFQKS